MTDAPLPTPTPTPTPIPSEAPPVSLTDLGNQIGASPTPTPQPRAVPRGDDVMAKANARLAATDEEKYFAKRFMRAQEAIQSRLDTDDAYAEKHWPELQKLADSGDEKYIERVLDEGDNIRVEQLKRDYPDLMSGSKSAIAAMANGATFGQLSRIYGLANAAEGKDYSSSVEEAAETLRLMHKANPVASYAGEFASYLIPGSPVKALFSRLAGWGFKAGTKAAASGTATAILSKIASDPKKLAQLTKAMSGAAGEVGAGVTAGAGEGAIRGTLGTDLEAMSLDRGLEHGLLGGALGGLVAGAVPVAAYAGRKTVVPVAKAVGGFVSDATEKLTGVAADALRQSAPGFFSGFGALAGSERRAAGERIAQHAGKESSIALRVQERIRAEKAAHTEVTLANQLLEKIPGEVDLSGYFRGLRKKPGVVPPDLKKSGTFEQLDEWAGYGEKLLEGMGHVGKASLAASRKLVDEMDDVVDRAVANGGGFIDPKRLPTHLQILKDQTAKLRKAIYTEAERVGGEDGATYGQLMRKASQKARLGEFMLKKLGNDPEEVGSRLIGNIFGKRNEIALARMKRLDELYGTNFAKDAEAAYFARQLGGSGAPRSTPGWLPTQSTGRSALGVVTGGYVADRMTGFGDALPPELKTAGQVLGGAIALASSPRVGRKIIGASDSMTKFATALFSQPQTLARLAGVPVKGAPKGASQNVRVPEDVRRIAREVYDTFKKEGPLSAASTLRLVADTPYFLPLVHYHEVASRRSDAKDGAESLAKQTAPGGAQPTR